MDKTKKYVMALDQGTTSSRAIIFNHRGEAVATAQKPFEQIFPRNGWVEHDPSEIWYTQSSVAAEAIARADLTGQDIACIGITNQRETTILWDRETSLPIYNAIVWQDRRTSAYCEQLIREGKGETIREKTGLRPDSYFSATKIKWILDHVEGARERAEKGKLCFGTVDSWLLWRLTRGKIHATDVSNASRTMLFNIRTLQWDDELLKMFDIPPQILPEVKASSEIYSETSTTLFSTKIPISGIAGDQHAALFGQQCLEAGMTKTTYGTGCFMMMNTGGRIVTSKNNLLSTVAWKIGDRVNYALEGSVFVGGAVVQWLRDTMKLVQSWEEVQPLAESVPDNGGVYFVPALTGLAAPYWDQYARGMLIGLTRGTQPAHIVRAALEGIAYQVYDVLKAMEEDTQTSGKAMKVDGGAIHYDFLMQFQADIFRGDIIRPNVHEVTALGAAYMAGLAVGYWEGTEQLKDHGSIDRVFTPLLPADTAQAYIDRWHKAVGKTLDWMK